MYDKFNEKLPKYWVVKLTKENQEEFKNTVGKYVTNVYKMGWMCCDINSYYGYEGTLAFKGTNCYSNYENFKNNPTILTLEEFKSYFKEFELPKKWCILKDKQEVCDWFNKNSSNHYSLVSRNTHYIHHPAVISDYRLYSAPVEGYTEITFEQFKKYVLKQEIVMKEIIGYKLKKGCEQYKEAIKQLGSISLRNSEIEFLTVKVNNETIPNLQKAGVLDLWFEPVYEEGFKVGDWVVVLDKGTSDLRVGDIGKITCLGADKSHPDFKVEARGITAVNWLEPKDVRLATSEEIAKVSVKKLYFGKVKFTIKPGQDYAETEHGKVPKKDIKEAIDWVKNAPTLAGYKFTIHNTKSGKYEKLTDISTGCIEDTMIGFGCRYGKLSELEAIYKAFD